MKSLLSGPISFAVLPVLVACSGEPKGNPATPAEETTSTPDAGRRRGKPEGAMCGGIAGLRCEEGLDCVTPPPMYPDKSGTCQKP